MQLFLRLALGPEVASGGPKNSSLNPGKLENTGFFQYSCGSGHCQGVLLQAAGGRAWSQGHGGTRVAT